MGNFETGDALAARAASLLGAAVGRERLE